MLGMNTLGATMNVLRLVKEWEMHTRLQYQQDVTGDVSTGSQQVDCNNLIRLLTRCKMMYEAKNVMQRLLKIIVQREELVKYCAKIGSSTSPTDQAAYKDAHSQVTRLSKRIVSQINTLQEEHRIFKRPFVLHGRDYLQQLQFEGKALE